jgi:CBS domain-containing protein
MDEANLYILPEANVVEADKKMRYKKLGALIIAEGGQNLGIITETDLSRKIVAEELNPKETKFMMATPIVSIEKDSSMMSEFFKNGVAQYPARCCDRRWIGNGYPYYE